MATGEECSIQLHGAEPAGWSSASGGFHKGGTPKWMVYKFIRDNPIDMDDLGVPPFVETSKWGPRSAEKSCLGPKKDRDGQTQSRMVTNCGAWD